MEYTCIFMYIHHCLGYESRLGACMEVAGDLGLGGFFFNFQSRYSSYLHYFHRYSQTVAEKK